MKALCRDLNQYRKFSVEEVECPVPGPGQVLIRVAYAGVCGSDLHIYDGSDADLPQAIHGHEFSGVVAEIGSGVENVSVGQRVTAEHTYATCGRCEHCMSGRYNLCKHRQSIGFDIQGAFAEFVVVDSKYVHILPDSVSLAWAALTEPLACVYHFLRLSKLPPVGRVLVIGPGPMGYLAAAVMRTAGHDVYVIGTAKDELRLKVFRDNDFAVINEAEDSSFDAIFECSGSKGGVRSALAAAKRGGTILQLGIATEDISLPYGMLVYKELQIQGGFCHTHPSWEMAIAAMSLGTVSLEPIITDIATIDDWDKTFDNLMNQNSLKVLFKFDWVEEE